MKNKIIHILFFLSSFVYFTNVHAYGLLNSEEEKIEERRRFKIVGPLWISVGGDTISKGLEFGGVDLGIIYGDPGVGLEILGFALWPADGVMAAWLISPRVVFMKEIPVYKSNVRPPFFVSLFFGWLPFICMTDFEHEDFWTSGVEGGFRFFWPIKWIKEEERETLMKWYRKLNPLFIIGLEIKYRRIFSLPYFAEEKNFDWFLVGFSVGNMALPLK